MRRHLPWILLLAALACQAAPAVNVTVSFIHPEQFIDAKDARGESDKRLLAMAKHLQWLGSRYLAADQTLRVEVLDVDLAGRERFLMRSGQEVRIDNGKADWPEIKLRYTLQAGGQVVQQGEEVVTDMGYLAHANSYDSGDPLRYEKQMLERWFRGHFEHAPATDTTKAAGSGG